MKCPKCDEKLLYFYDAIDAPYCGPFTVLQIDKIPIEILMCINKNCSGYVVARDIIPKHTEEDDE